VAATGEEELISCMMEQLGSLEHLESLEQPELMAIIGVEKQPELMAVIGVEE
jgi:hypothetical protein